MKGEDHAGLTEEDIQLRRIKARLCTALFSCPQTEELVQSMAMLVCMRMPLLLPGMVESVLCLSGYTGEEQAQSAEVQGAPEGKTNLLPCLIYRDDG